MQLSYLVNDERIVDIALYEMLKRNVPHNPSPNTWTCPTLNPRAVLRIGHPHVPEIQNNEC